MSTAREGDDSVAEPELGPEARMGAAMKAAREAKGLSRRALARELYMSHSNLSEYENGHRLAPALADVQPDGHPARIAHLAVDRRHRLADPAQVLRVYRHVLP